MKHIKQEQSDELNVSNERYRQVCRQLLEEQRRIEELKETYYKKDGSVLTDQEMELFKQAYTGEQKRIYPLRADQQQP